MLDLNNETLRVSKKNNETLRHVAIVSLPFTLEVSNYNCHKRISLWENSKKIP